MNDSPRPKRKRASRRAIRAWGWTAGALSFMSPFILFGLSPKPVQASTDLARTQKSSTRPARRPVVIVVTRKIVYARSPTTSVSSSGGGPITYVPAPTAAPVAVSCGSTPC